MSERDFYDVLSISKQASQDEIKQAYRQMALKYHPDRNAGDKRSEEKFKEAATAYQVLGDPEKRAQYDRFGHQGFQSAQGHHGFQDVHDIFSSFSDIFEQMGFGGSSGFSSRGGFDSFFSSSYEGFSQQRSHRKGADLRYRKEIALKDVLHGGDQIVEFTAELNCSSCKGTGAKNGTALKTCSQCGGKGQTMRQQAFISFSSQCSLCQGQGEVVSTPCGACQGKGQSRQKKKLVVHIPKGVETGTRLRVQGEGESGYKSGENGDLYIEVQVKNDTSFERLDRGNVQTRLDISYLRALLGGSVSAPSLEGVQNVDIPKGSQPGDQITIKRQGLPLLGSGGRRGDLVYIIQVKIPKKLKKKELTLIQELAEQSGENF